MKNLVCLLLVASTCLHAADNPPKQPEVRPAAQAPRPIRNFHDMLAALPKEMEPENARHWSQAERDTANIILKKKLVDTNRPASIRFRVQSIDAWPGVTVWAQLPENEGYPVRIFVGRWKEANYLPKVATLRPGDYVEMNGVCDAALFQNLWNSESFTIGLREASFIKLDAHGKPVPAPAKIALNVISAVFGNGEKFIDVSDSVRAFLNEPGAVFSAHPHWIGIDPNPGGSKQLIIVYETQGKRRVFSCGDGGEVSAAILSTPNEAK